MIPFTSRICKFRLQSFAFRESSGVVNSLRQVRPYSASRRATTKSSSWGDYYLPETERPFWTQEWKELGLGCKLVDHDETTHISNLFFVQMGFGVDQHGDNDATKAAMRAVRNAIEFNSIPGVIEAIPGGRKKMLIQVKLGIPPGSGDDSSILEPMNVDPLQIAKVFPYGRLLPIQKVVGGLSFSTGRLVPELGDKDDLAVCVAACVSIGYNSGESKARKQQDQGAAIHTVYSTQDGH